MFKSSSRKQNFTEGPLFVKIILFAVPIMLTSVLQTFYNMADNIVVGRFSGDPLALAAVGSVSSLFALIVNLIVGISAGTGVVVAQAFGAKDDDILSHATHTSITFSAIAGLVFMSIGLLVSRPALIAMGTQPELLDSAVLYMRIVCFGIPASAVYNFSATTLRSVGDSKTPLIILSSAGVINVILNLFFIIVCKMTVDGVALATIVSQYASAVWVIAVLVKRKDEIYAVSFKKLAIHIPTLLRILKYGVPAALQSSMYSISNILITSATNVFTSIEMSAKTIVSSIDGIMYNSLNSYLHASMTVTAQNYGAGQYGRIRRALGYTLLQVTAIGLVFGAVLSLLAEPVSSLFVDLSDPNRTVILEKSCELLRMMLTMYFFCGIQESLSGTLRGLGYSILPMFMSVVGICGTRVLWIVAFYNIPSLQSLIGLYSVYPVSWVTATIALGICTAIAMSRLSKKIQSKNLSDPKNIEVKA
ncbi:MAG: MATE family efflux transporter [Clostridia bacterium]|nr:MATE family efflux transporter [Clostridia bacterium]